MSHEPAPRASYAHTQDAQAQLWAELRRLTRSGSTRFCEVGGGVRPVIPMVRIEKLGLEYIVLDELNTALEKLPPGYKQFEASILDSGAIDKLVDEQGAFDVVVSRWAAEHIPDGRRFHQNVYKMLRPGGTAVHFFPTLYSLPFVLNRVLPPALSSELLSRAWPDRHSKFRPYYSWCRGPSARQIERLESVGFSVERYTGFFGHGYFAGVKPLRVAGRFLADRLCEHPSAYLTSFALVVLVRPG
jgi:SAM-dependent methyltransferase